MGVELARAFVRVRADNTRLRGDMKRSQSIVAGGMARIGSIARDAFAGLGAIGLGAGLFAGFRKVVEFEDTMVKLRINARLLGDEGEEAFSRLEDKARDLGSTTRFAASEAADSLNRLVLAGLSTEDAMVAVEQVLNGAAAAGIGLEQTANILTTQMKIWKFEAGELARVNDTLLSAQSRLRAEMPEIADGMSVAGSMAKQVGLSFEQTAAMVGTMIEQGTAASQAGTTIRNVLIRMARAPKEMQDAMGELGLSLEDFKDQSGELNFEKFLNALKDVELTSEQTAKLFGARGGEFIKVLGAIDDEGRRGMDSINALAKGMRDDAGFAAEAAASRMDTLLGSLLELKSAMEELALSILTPVMEGFAAVGAAVTVAVRAFAAFNEMTGGLVSEAIKVTTAMLAFSFIIPKLIAGIKLLGAVIRTQLISTGVGALVVAIGLAILALQQLFKWLAGFPAIQDAWSGAVEKLQKAWENFKAAMGVLWDAIVAAVNSAIDAIESAFGVTIGDMQSSFIGFVADLITGFADFVLNVSQWIRVLAENWSSIVEFMRNKFFIMVLRIRDAASGVFTFLVEGFKRTGIVIAKFFAFVWQDIKQKFGQGSKDAVDAAVRELRKAEQKLGDTFRDAFEPSDEVKALEERNREIFDQLRKAKMDLAKAQNEALEADEEPKGAAIQQVVEKAGEKAGKKMAEQFRLDQGRFGFAEFGRAIQDKLLEGKDDSDKKRNDLLENGNKIQDKMLGELGRIKDKVGKGGPLALSGGE